MTVPLWLTEAEHRTLGAALDRLFPNDGESPGGGEAGGADYVDLLLAAFQFDPPRIWAGGPFSGRHGGDAGFDRWLELAPMEELAWRIRVEGTAGQPEREFNGPVTGWQERYRSGLAALGADFADRPAKDQDEQLATAIDADFREVLVTHGCEALYGDPVYGGNRGTIGWQAIGFDGDVQPRGWTDAEVQTPAVRAPGAQP